MRKKPIPVRAYHHGNLKHALLDEAEKMLERSGIQALTLRAVTRAAGVSHTASYNHFGDLTGLLSELAAVGFQRFAARLSEAMEMVGADPKVRMTAMGTAYVGFARAHPGLFALMFRNERLDATRPALRDGIQAARDALRIAAAARASDRSLSPLQLVAQAAAMWSLVHGFAVLLMEGRLDGMLRSLPNKDGVDAVLEELLTTTTVGN